MKPPFGSSWLFAGAFWELLRYDLAIRVFGFRKVVRQTVKVRSTLESRDPNLESRVCNAMKWAQSLYFKRALCLQRSVATARLLRRCGLDAGVVIGCRAEPFASHAWVEIGGRIVNDSPAYQKMMCVLERI